MTVAPPTDEDFAAAPAPETATVDDGLVSEIAYLDDCSLADAREWIDEHGAREAFQRVTGHWSDAS